MKGHRIGWREPIHADFDYIHYSRPAHPTVGPPVDVLQRTHETRKAIAKALTQEINRLLISATWTGAPPIGEVMVPALATVLGPTDE